MELTEAQRHILMELVRYPGGRPFREDHEKAAIDELCRAVPPLVCDPHTMKDSIFTRITSHGKDVLFDDETAIARMCGRDLMKSI